MKSCYRVKDKKSGGFKTLSVKEAHEEVIKLAKKEVLKIEGEIKTIDPNNKITSLNTAKTLKKGREFKQLLRLKRREKILQRVIQSGYGISNVACSYGFLKIKSLYSKR